MLFCSKICMRTKRDYISLNTKDNLDIIQEQFDSYVETCCHFLSTCEMDITNFIYDRVSNDTDKLFDLWEMAFLCPLGNITTNFSFFVDHFKEEINIGQFNAM